MTAMDDGQRQPPRQSRPDTNRSSPRQDGDAQPGGLLSRYGGRSADEGGMGGAQRGPEPPTPARGSPPPSGPAGDNRRDDGAPPRGGGLLRRFGQANGAASQAWDKLTGHERRPAKGDWRASDYDSQELDALIDSDEWNQQGSDDRGRSGRRDRGRRDVEYSRAYQDRPSARSWDDEAEWDRDWDRGWETGTWDTGWATGWNYAAADDQGGWGDEDEWNGGDGYEDGAWSRSLVALGAASMAEIPMGRVARLRLVLREQPAAGTMLIVFLLGFFLTSLAPLIPLMRLGYDVADAARRASHLQTLVKSAGTQLIQPAKLQEVQTDVDSIERDLYEINAVTNVLGAPLAAMSPTMKDYRLLVRMGLDLTAAADEGLQVGQTLLTPLQGGALAASDNSPGITPSDIEQARSVLADAQVRVKDAIAAYQALDQNALPKQLRPGSKYGSYLALLPTATTAFNELNTLMAIAPGLLGVGQPAYYLVVAMDRTELRPGGGFQGNYGILTLQGGKQPASQPLALNDTYKLDRKYYTHTLQTQGADVGYANQECGLKHPTQNVTPDYYGPEPPNYYWWWPYRNFSWCFNWGLRDSNLSADFPSNARTAMSIVQQSNVLPGPGQLQGVVAFTPALIADLLNLPEIGSISLPQYPGDVPVTAQNLEQQIHCHQLPFGTCPGAKTTSKPSTADRKEFTHLLSQAMLAKIKTLHGSGLKPVIEVALQAMKSKDLQVYFADPRAELILQELGLASQVYTGGGDGFFVVDTNDGGNKANLYVTERQQDLVTLLPNGGAIHRLEITVTYAYPKGGWVYADATTPEDYNAVERVYMPGGATLLGYSGFAIPPAAGSPLTLPHPLNDGSDGNDHFMWIPVTNSDVAGRTMVMGFVDVSCHNDLYSGQPMYSTTYQQPGEQSCYFHPNTNQQVIDIEWYTPNAWAPSGNGHGRYTELVEKQAGTDGPPSAKNPSGSVVTVEVYVDTGLLHQSSVQGIDWTDAGLRAEALKHAKQLFNGPLVNDTTVSYSW